MASTPDPQHHTPARLPLARITPGQVMLGAVALATAAFWLGSRRREPLLLERTRERLRPRGGAGEGAGDRMGGAG